METLLEERSATQTKMDRLTADQRAKVVQMTEERERNSVQIAAQTDEKTKNLNQKIDSELNERMRQEQKFLSQNLNDAQKHKEEQTAKAQNHLQINLNEAQEMESSAERLAKMDEEASEKADDFVTDNMASRKGAMKKRLDLVEAAEAKQIEHHQRDERHRNEMIKELNALTDEMTSLKAVQEQQLAIIKLAQESYKSVEAKIKAAQEKIDAVKADLESGRKETKAIRSIGEGAIKTFKSLEQADIDEMNKEANKFRGEMDVIRENQGEMIGSLRAKIQKNRDAEKNFVGELQDAEKAKYERMEVEFRVRSNEASEHLQRLHQLTREVVTTGSEARSRVERDSEAHVAALMRWKEDAEEESQTCEDNIRRLDGEMRDEIDAERDTQNRLFNEEIRRDSPTGETPQRKTERSYPRSLIKATPDSVRAKQYREKRDLNAAMALNVEVLDEDDEADNDSVVSESTNATDVDSRRNSKENASVKSEEVGYGSDRENREPFVKPGIAGSKLKQPKIYSSSSNASSKIATRSRSSSRTRTARNVLGSNS